MCHPINSKPYNQKYISAKKSYESHYEEIFSGDPRVGRSEFESRKILFIDPIPRLCLVSEGL